MQYLDNYTEKIRAAVATLTRPQRMAKLKEVALAISVERDPQRFDQLVAFGDKLKKVCEDLAREEHEQAERERAELLAAEARRMSAAKPWTQHGPATDEQPEPPGPPGPPISPSVVRGLVVVSVVAICAICIAQFIRLVVNSGILPYVGAGILGCMAIAYLFSGPPAKAENFENPATEPRTRTIIMEQKIYLQ